MQDLQLQYLSALFIEGNLVDAAQRCAVPPGKLRAEIALLEAEYRQPLLNSASGDAALTSAGNQLLEWMLQFDQQCTSLRDEIRRDRLAAAMAPLLSRRSVSPKRLKLPAPAADEIDLMVQAALRGPDHGAVRPWRLVGFAEHQRAVLADLFEAEKQRRNPLASGADLLRARDHATRPPALLAFVVSPQIRHLVPVREQWLAAGAALGNFLNAAHQLGFGAIMLSGERCHDAQLTATLGVARHEFLAGFISLGTVSQAPPPSKAGSSADVFSTWDDRMVERASPKG